MRLKSFLAAFIVIPAIFLVLTNLALAHGMSEAEKTAALDGGVLQYIWLGATHMLTGYDHLAFVFGIIFFLVSFKDIAKYVTAFTVGHSVTLIYATLNGIQFNYYLIDAIIALSVCYIAFHNLDGFRKYLNINPPNMMAMITGLGLIHGFGLSSILQGLALDKDNLLANIISFNVGIELGQLIALASMLLAINFWRKTSSFKPFSRVVNSGLIIAGLGLFLMQMQAYAASKSTTQINEAKVSSEDKPGAQTPMKNTEWRDEITVIIPAKAGKEYKFFAKKDASIEFTWQTSNGEALYFDFHGEPEGDTTGYFKSYKVWTDIKASGKLKAPFAGTHGWYWKNESPAPVTITLKAKGDYKRLDK